MADKRKLQSDIDRTLKRIQEGRSAFQEILDKFESSGNQTQKEKFEGDLKKEIKKLQRLRDQIKTWLTANEVKDKQPLVEARKEIEQDMERFKVIEKETKTKAYSKEGLLSTDAKKDPIQKEKEELDEWLKQCISSLNTQMEKYEFEIESLTNSNKKKRVDKETAVAIEEKRQRLENCSFHVEKLETVMRLLDNERLDCALLRSIKEPIEYVIQSCDDISSLDYRDMYDDLRLDEIGDSSGITSAAGGTANATEQDLSTSTATINHRTANDDAGSSTSTHTSASTNTESSGIHPTSSTSSNASSRERTKSEDKVTAINSVSASSTSTPLKITSNVSSTTSGQTGKHKSSNLANQTAPPALMSQIVAGTPNKSNKSYSSHITNGSPLGFSSSTETAVGKSGSPHVTDVQSSQATSDSQSRTPRADKHGGENRSKVASLSENTPELANMVNAICSISTCSSTPISNLPPINNKLGFSAVVATQTVSNFPSISTTSTSSLDHSATVHSNILSLSASSVPYTVSLSSNISSALPFNLPSTNSVSSPQDRHFYSLLSSSQGAVGSHIENMNVNVCVGLDNSLSSSFTSKLHAAGLPSITSPASQTAFASLDKQLPALPTQLHGQQSRVPSCIQMHPRDAAAPFRNRNLDKSKGPIPQELLLQLQALESGYRRLPHPCDTEKARMIVCKNTVNGPSYYPREPLPGTDTEEYYMKLDAQTLFFIFYYFEGTKAQYFAAKALKRMSWRFHTKYMMWFQRHEEPKQITDEYESGSYIYYDFKTMSQRKKEEFVFQYSFLEDKDF